MKRSFKHFVTIFTFMLQFNLINRKSYIFKENFLNHKKN